MRKMCNISYSGRKDCILDLYLPEQDRFDVVVFFHGGGLESGDKADNIDTFLELTDKGIAVASANYRMYSDAKYPEFIEDAAEAIKWVADNIKVFWLFGREYSIQLMKGFGHTGYDHALDENGENILARLMIEFIRSSS